MTDDRSYSGTVVAAVIFTAMAVGIAYRYWPSDERSIRRHLTNLAETLSLPYAEREVERLTRFAALSEYFSPDVSIEIAEREIVTREALLAALRQWQSPPGGLVVEFSDAEIRLTGPNTGEVALIARMTMTDPATAKPASEQRPLNLEMLRQDGDWVISKVKSQK